jgi:hypothetical protein
MNEYYWGHKIKTNVTGNTCGKYRRKERCILVLVMKPERKKSPERLRQRWEDNIKMDL